MLRSKMIPTVQHRQMPLRSWVCTVLGLRSLSAGIPVQKNAVLGGQGHRQQRSLPTSKLTVAAAAQAAEAPTTVPSPPRDPKLYAGKKAVVVGAGPAGSTAAMYLADQGFSVDVYEKRPEPSTDAVDNGRAYIIILIPRGRAALEELKIEIPNDPEFVTQGTVRHDNKGKVSVTKEEGNVTFSRSDLAQFLIDQAKARHPGKINFHFNADVEAVNFEAKEVKFSQAGSAVAASYDLLVGADGVASKVRDALASHIPGYQVDVNSSGRDYKVYLNVAGDIEPPEFQGKPGATLHLWSATGSDPLSSFTAHSNPDGTYSGTFSLATGSFTELTKPEQYEELLASKFIGIPKDWVTIISKQIASTPASPAGKRIRCSQLNGPNTVLIGDSAHAVTPVFGQGANSSLEDSPVLAKALAAANGDVSKIPATYDAARRADAHALYEIDRKAFSLFRRNGPFDTDFMQLASHVVVGSILSRVVPFLYGKEVKLLKLGSAPYSEILEAVNRDSKGAAVFSACAMVVAILKFSGNI